MGVLGTGELELSELEHPLPFLRRHNGRSSFRHGPLGLEPLAAPYHPVTRARARARQTLAFPPRRRPLLLGSLLWLLLLREQS